MTLVLPFYEIIYETGAHSVAQYDDDTEALRGIQAHHDRAVNGEQGGPTGHPAERIKRVLVYETHPTSLNEAQILPVEEMRNELEAMLSDLALGGQVSVPELAAHVRQLTLPTVDSGPHESNFKAEEVKELTPSWQ